MKGNVAPTSTGWLSASQQFLKSVKNQCHSSAAELGDSGIENLRADLLRSNTRVSTINNRRYLGNKHGITRFIRNVVDNNCPDIKSVADVFTGTGAVANAFTDKTLTTNDILYSNYLSSVAWFSPQQYRPGTIVAFVDFFNSLDTDENNYMRKNFADTYFRADDCSAIGEAREIAEQAYTQKIINKREHAILVTSILYGMDRIANTVGHYDAYRRNASFDRILDFPVLLPDWNLPPENKTLNKDANEIISNLDCDLLYIDPPYNSRQYSDAYHLLENIARWDQPDVFGVARKMDRTLLKSDYNTVRAAEALRDLVSKTTAKYIVLSYNNMAAKGNGRSNAKISDEEILAILEEKGTVTVHETSHKAFSTGKSSINDNSERLFVCKVKKDKPVPPPIVLSPINYIGGKGRLLPQLQPLLQPVDSEPWDCFIDVFAGGCNVGSNMTAKNIIFNDTNVPLVNLIQFLANNDADEIIRRVEHKVSSYKLSDTYHQDYESFQTKSSIGLASFNKPGYSRLRDDYNRYSPEDRERDLILYVLIIFGFNNQLRFNKKGEFNLPVGKRDFNAKMRRKLVLFQERMKSIDYTFTTNDFRDIGIAGTPENTLFYCDPPYLITNASYNERGGWSETDERDLLSFLEGIDQSGRRFALSNVTQTKGRSNNILNLWLSNNNFNTHTVTMSYNNSNYQRTKDASPTTEVVVTNF